MPRKLLILDLTKLDTNT